MKDFDFADGLEIWHGHLPHWRQDGATYFVTFRLADSIPKEKQDELASRRRYWCQSHRPPYSKRELDEYAFLFSDQVHEWLDAGYGRCFLANPRFSELVRDALAHFDGCRYWLEEWAVAPNHTHVLLTPVKGFPLDRTIRSWMSFTARKINVELGQMGQVWQHEAYDHIVRNLRERDAVQKYILHHHTSVKSRRGA
ncbi:MAG: transposase [Lentisphaeria bacterium]|nr:transposase [Lentisphaeria bacterium]